MGKRTLLLLWIAALPFGAQASGKLEAVERDYNTQPAAPAFQTPEKAHAKSRGCVSCHTAFRDSLREDPPRDSTDFPRPPAPTLTTLEPLMTIEGSFTATPGTLSNQVTRPQWSLSGGILAP